MFCGRTGLHASHFAPALLAEAFAVYRDTFRPSHGLARPYAVMAVGVCAAATDAEADVLRSSQVLAFAREDGPQRLLCAFNFSDSAAVLALPEGWTQANTLTGSGLAGASVDAGRIRFEPWGGLFLQA